MLLVFHPHAKICALCPQVCSHRWETTSSAILYISSEIKLTQMIGDEWWTSVIFTFLCTFLFLLRTLDFNPSGKSLHWDQHNLPAADNHQIMLHKWIRVDSAGVSSALTQCFELFWSSVRHNSLRLYLKMVKSIVYCTKWCAIPKTAKDPNFIYFNSNRSKWVNKVKLDQNNPLSWVAGYWVKLKVTFLAFTLSVAPQKCIACICEVLPCDFFF